MIVSLSPGWFASSLLSLTFSLEVGFSLSPVPSIHSKSGRSGAGWSHLTSNPLLSFAWLPGSCLPCPSSVFATYAYGSTIPPPSTSLILVSSVSLEHVFFIVYFLSFVMCIFSQECLPPSLPFKLRKVGIPLGYFGLNEL